MAPVRISTSQASHALETGEAKLWALLVGVNHYGDEGLSALRYPAMDCQGLGDAIAAATALFPRKTLMLHCTGAGGHASPTLAAVTDSLAAIARQAQSQDTVLIYFSGHGVLSGSVPPQSVLCLEDTRTDDLAATGLSLNTLLHQLTQCAARHQLLWLDACHSGSLTLRGGKDAQPVAIDPLPQLIDVLRQRARQSQGFYALLSCDQQQRSWEFPELGHGVFSYFLMQGLRGEAADAQGVVEADALYKYVYYQTLRYIDTANQQLRLINQQRRHRGQAYLLAEYPLQTPKRIVEGIGELVLGVVPPLSPTPLPRQALVLTAGPPGSELLRLGQQLQQQGGFAFHYHWPGQGADTVQERLDRLLEGASEAAQTAPSRTVLLYLQGTLEQAPSGDALLRLGQNAAVSRAWLRQRLRRAVGAQHIVMLDDQGGVEDAALQDWVEDLQLGPDHSQAILAGLSSGKLVTRLLDSLAAAPESGLSIAGWIALLQRQGAEGDGVLHTWISSPRVIEVLLGQRGDRGLGAPETVDLGICPYRGLQAFQLADAPYFFGREGLTQQLLMALHRQSLVAVVGASGSGKSSVVQAGLMAHLRQGQHIPGSDRWWLGGLRPGDRPGAALVKALVDPGTEREQFYQQQQIEGLLHQGSEGFVQWLRSRPEPVVVLVIDQFEELFSLSTEGDRSHFLTLVLGGLAHAGDRFKLVITLRSDFMATALEDSALATLLPPATVLVPPVLAPDDYRQIILNPAAKVGLQVEPALVDVLLRDLDRGIGNLPLLEFVLEQIWLHRDGGTLHLATYQHTVGGLEGALDRKAQTVYDSLDPAAQSCARWLFLSLTHLGDGTEDTRRRLPRPALTVPRYPADLVDRTLEAFVTAKLIVISTDSDTSPLSAHPKSQDSDVPTPSPPPTLEVAHEILIRRWSTLRWWLDENRTRLRSQRQIEQATQQWHSAGQQPEYLLRGVRLEAATELYVHHTDELSQPVQEFIEACLAAQQHDQRQQQQRLQRARLAVGAIASLAAVALGLGGWAYLQQQRALASEIAALNALAEAQWQSDQPLESLITSIQAGRQLQRLQGAGLGAAPWASTRDQTLTVLYQAVTQVSERNRLLGHGQRVNRAVTSPDGSQIASASDDGTVRLWSSDGKPLRVLEGRDRFTDVAFYLQGKGLAASSADGSVWLWALDSEAEPTVLPAHAEWVSRLAFSPDGSLLVTTSRDGTLRLWRVADLKLVRTFPGHLGWVNTVQFSPDGRQLASGGEDQTVRLWDVGTGENIATRSTRREAQESSPAGDDSSLVEAGDRVNDLAFSPDGRLLVSVSDDHTLGLWSLPDNVLTLLDTGDRPTSVQVSPDSQLILTGMADGTLHLWRVAHQSVVSRLAGHSSTVHSVAFVAPMAEPETGTVPQRVTLLSAGADRTLRLWQAPVPADAPVAADPSQYPVALHPEGDRYAVGGIGAIMLQSRDQRQRLPIEGGAVLALAFTPDGETLAAGDDKGTIRLWHVQTGQVARTLGGHSDRITSLAFGPGGHLLSGSADQTATLWRNETGESLATLNGHADALTSVAVSPRRSQLATGSADGGLKLWQADGRPRHDLAGHNLAIAALAFSPDDRLLASAGWDRTLRLWRVADGTLLHTLPTALDTPLHLRFTSAGHTLVAEDRYGHSQVWHVATGQDLTTLAPAPATQTPQVLTPDGVLLPPPLALVQQLDQPQALTMLLNEGCDRAAAYLATTATAQPRRALCP